MKETVLIVHNYYQIPGGEDTVVANEKAMLENHGHKVILYKRNNSELNTMGKLAKIKLPFTTVYNHRTYREIVEIIKNEQVDVVHVHNTLNLISAAVYYAAVSCDIPVVQTIHNYRLLCPKATFYRDAKICEDCVTSGLGCAVRHKCYRNSFAQTLCCVIATKYHRMKGIYGKINYLCLTDFGKEKLLSMNSIYKNKCMIAADNVYVKPNYMPKTIDSIVPYNLRKRQLVFAGRLDETKGIKELLKAWKRLNDQESVDVDLLICGEGPLREWCDRFINDNHLPRVTMLGKVEHSEVVAMLSECMAMILPTRWYEGFPMSIAESYSVGTPVVGPSMGNVGCIIEDGVTGIKYASGDNDAVDSIVGAIEKMLVHANDNSLYEGAYNAYLSKYTEDINYEQLITIYQDVISKNK